MGLCLWHSVNEVADAARSLEVAAMLERRFNGLADCELATNETGDRSMFLFCGGVAILARRLKWDILGGA